MKNPQMSWASEKKKHNPSKKLKDTIKFFDVDGTEIRNHVDIDFTEGGHGYHYDYIPKDEIWVESEKDRECTMVHEFVERLVQKEFKIDDYEEAHDDFALPMEQLFREILVKKGILE